MESLKAYLNHIHPVESSILEDYIALWKPITIPRKQVMTSPEQTEKFLYFVTEGIQKSYYLRNGKEHIITFAYAPSFSGILESFFLQKPSRYFLETITPSQFIRISYSQHVAFMNDHRDLETLFRKAMEFFLDGVIQRQHELMALDMETRFKVFTERSAHLLQLIPQKDLASYLRIDSTNFSKLINRITI